MRKNRLKKVKVVKIKQAGGSVYFDVATIYGAKFEVRHNIWDCWFCTCKGFIFGKMCSHIKCCRSGWWKRRDNFIPKNI